jgi:hypothetical protein
MVMPKPRLPLRHSRRPNHASWERNEAAKIALDVNPLSGEQMTVLIDNIFRSDPATLQRAAAIMKP